MKYIIVFFITLVLLGVFIYLEDTPSPSTKMGRTLMKQVARKLEERYGMEQMLIDEAGDEDTYTLMGMGFSLKRVVGKDEGRRILVDCVETFLSEVNSNDQFQQYMSVHPFTSKNIDISLYISHPDGTDVFHPNVGVFASGSGTLYYYYETPENEYGYHSIEKESYEDAAKIVASH